MSKEKAGIPFEEKEPSEGKQVNTSSLRHGSFHPDKEQVIDLGFFGNTQIPAKDNLKNKRLSR